MYSSLACPGDSHLLSCAVRREAVAARPCPRAGGGRWLERLRVARWWCFQRCAAYSSHSFFRLRASGVPGCKLSVFGVPCGVARLKWLCGEVCALLWLGERRQTPVSHLTNIRPPWPHSGQRLSGRHWSFQVFGRDRGRGLSRLRKNRERSLKCMASSLSFQPVEAKLRAFARGWTPVAG